MIGPVATSGTGFMKSAGGPRPCNKLGVVLGAADVSRSGGMDPGMDALAMEGWDGATAFSGAAGVGSC